MGEREGKGWWEREKTVASSVIEFPIITFEPLLPPDLLLNLKKVRITTSSLFSLTAT